MTESGTILVTGATGYVGARLVTRLLEKGYRVRATGRSLDRLRKRPWANHPGVELFPADMIDPASIARAPASIARACEGCAAAYYLVHSMMPGEGKFEEVDREAARNMARAAEEAGLSRLIYLGGLGEENPSLSRHLRSRTEVAEILAAGTTPATTLRAAMILGAGSASFEILRYLVDRLPVMITPKWVSTECQPIGIRNVLDYLVGCLETTGTTGGTFDIGGPEVVTYRELMRIYAREAGLPPRIVIPVPVLTPRLSSYWIHLVTPVHAEVARPLAEGLSNRVVCGDTRIRGLIPLNLSTCREAIRATLGPRNFRFLEDDQPPGRLPWETYRYPGDAPWAGGTFYHHSQRLSVRATPAEVWEGIEVLGGKNGWYTMDWLWSLRGFLDHLWGGIGMRKGNRKPGPLSPGAEIDFWRAVSVTPRRELRLVAEMKLPGDGVLSFRLRETEPGTTELTQTAQFLPRGLGGMAYWAFFGPFHRLVFPGLILGIGRHTGKPIVSGPDPVFDDL
ncbi:MAG: a2 family oxidoreductase [Deltaproteobacteria bacterium]|nr:a2 family oxidoreductase [Deltaproteobacteria bacterium]